MKLAAVGLTLITGLGATAVTVAAQEKATKAVRRPGVTGDWVGTWGVYTPPAAGAEGEAPKKSPYPQMRLDCKVAETKDGKWQATFEGECGRPYKYTIQMLGRGAGDVVMFQGTADLGEKDGGVYDWIGRATDKEFVGFYTSEKYTGTFRLARPAPAVAAPTK